MAARRDRWPGQRRRARGCRGRPWLRRRDTPSTGRHWRPVADRVEPFAPVSAVTERWASTGVRWASSASWAGGKRRLSAVPAEPPHGVVDATGRSVPNCRWRWSVPLSGCAELCRSGAARPIRWEPELSVVLFRRGWVGPAECWACSVPAQPGLRLAPVSPRRARRGDQGTPPTCRSSSSAPGRIATRR